MTSFAAFGTPTLSCHLRVQACFINKNEAFRIEFKLIFKPVLPSFYKPRLLLLQCMCGLCLYVKPRARSQLLKALRTICTLHCSAKRTTISSSVISLHASIMPTMKFSCLSSREPRRRPFAPKAIRSLLSEPVTEGQYLKLVPSTPPLLETLNETDGR